MAYNLEIKERARSLFVETGFTFEQVQAETRISLSQLKKWGKEAKWSEEREDFEREYIELNGKVQRLKVRLITDALGKNDTESIDPQKVYAIAALLRVTSANKRAAHPDEDRAGIFLEFMGDMVSYLSEKDPEALRVMEPHIRGFAESMKEGDAQSA